MKSELELVLTAAFTDPKDSSAWFYQRWLLGYSDNKQEIVSALISKDKAILSFAKAISLQDENVVLETPVEELNEKSSWKSTNGLKTDLIWYKLAVENKTFQIPTAMDSMEISIKVGDDKLNFSAKKDGEDFFVLAKETSFGGTLSQPIVDELKSQLESCEQLLEFEPESKWTLLTAALLMRAIDREAYHQQTIDNLEKLKVVDCYRIGYYTDLIDKWNIERVLLQWLKEGDLNKAVDFSAAKLGCLYYEQYFAVAKKIDFGTEVVPERISRKMKIFKNL